MEFFPRSVEDILSFETGRTPHTPSNFLDPGRRRQRRIRLHTLFPIGHYLQSRKNFLRWLLGVKGLFLRQTTDTKRGRPVRSLFECLLLVDTTLRLLLVRETSIGVRSFVVQHWLILDFPRDVRGTARTQCS